MHKKRLKNLAADSSVAQLLSTNSHMHHAETGDDGRFSYKGNNRSSAKRREKRKEDRLEKKVPKCFFLFYSTSIQFFNFRLNRRGALSTTISRGGYLIRRRIRLRGKELLLLVLSNPQPKQK